MDEYLKTKGDNTDKSTEEIPSGVKFTRKVSQYRVGGMQVFEVAPKKDTCPIVLYIHGGAYIHNFNKLHWTAMAEWAKSTGCGLVVPNYPLLYGDMNGLPPVDLFTGTWEVFYTDILNTYDKMKSAGVDVRLHVKEKMGHVYPLWPCPEGKEARKIISSIIKEEL